MSRGERRDARQRRIAALLPWGVAVAAAAAMAWLFAPGWFSFDAAYLWWVVRGSSLDETVPVILALVWRGLAAVLPDPHGFFVAQLLLVWLGLAAVVSALPMSRGMQVAVLLVVGLWPPFLALQPQIWRDVWMVGALLWSVAALLRAQRGSSIALWLAWLPLAFAVATRPNAITAVLPLALWWAAMLVARWRASGAWPGVGGVAGVAGVGAVVVIGLLLLAALPSRLAGAKQAPMWPYVALWDLAAVSVETQRMLVPPAFRGQATTLAALAEGAREDSNVPVFASGAVIYIPEAGVAAADLRALRRAWLAMAREHPRAWLSHRWRLTGHLFGWRRDALHAPQVLAPGIVPYRDNPPLAPRPSAIRDALQGWWNARVGGPWFVAWPYLVALFVAGLWAWRRRAIPAAVVAASGLANALPLMLASTSAEFRYLAWTVVATLLVAVLLAAGAARRRAGLARG